MLCFTLRRPGIRCHALTLTFRRSFSRIIALISRTQSVVPELELLSKALSYRDRPAVSHDDVIFRYGDLLHHSAQLHARLETELHMSSIQGDRMYQI